MADFNEHVRERLNTIFREAEEVAAYAERTNPEWGGSAADLVIDRLVRENWVQILPDGYSELPSEADETVEEILDSHGPWKRLNNVDLGDEVEDARGRRWHVAALYGPENLWLRARNGETTVLSRTEVRLAPVLPTDPSRHPLAIEDLTEEERERLFESLRELHAGEYVVRIPALPSALDALTAERDRLQVDLTTYRRLAEERAVDLTAALAREAQARKDLDAMSARFHSAMDSGDVLLARMLTALKEQEDAQAREARLRKAIDESLQRLEEAEDNDRRSISSLVFVSALVRKHLENALVSKEVPS